jgi:hypothetical protein
MAGFFTLLALVVWDWGSFIVNYSDTEVLSYSKSKQGKRPLLLLFGSPRFEDYATILPPFGEAAAEARNYANFGHVEIDEEQRAAKRFGVQAAGPIVLFNSRGQALYKGELTTNAFLQFVVRILPANVEDIDEHWTTAKFPYVVLFSKKFKAPPSFAAVSAAFRRSDIRFGFASSAELFEDFGVEDPPKLLFSKGGEKKWVDLANEFVYDNLSAAVREFFVVHPDEL